MPGFDGELMASSCGSGAQPLTVPGLLSWYTVCSDCIKCTNRVGYACVLDTLKHGGRSPRPVHLIQYFGSRAVLTVSSVLICHSDSLLNKRNRIGTDRA